MKKFHSLFFILCLIFGVSPLLGQQGLVPAFQLKPCSIALTRIARPGTPFDKAGRKFAILGEESGSFEAWAYPLKLFRQFEFSFFVGSSTRPIPGKDIVQTLSVTPEATVLTYAYQSFTAKAVYITAVTEPGAIILLEVDSTEPLTLVCSFFPSLQPMWPAGLGGQYAFWDNTLKAYVISESSGKNHGLVGSPLASGISYTPAHMLSEVPNEFKIEINDPISVKGKFIPIIMAGGKGKRENVLNVYNKLQDNPEKFYQENLDHFRKLRDQTLHVHTPDSELNLAFEWAKVAFDNLLVENPDLGKGLIAGLAASGTSGRPGFGWFFGGDAYINCFSLLSIGAFETVRDAIAFTQKWQRHDGKMAHELSQAASYIDWWNDYHYGYIHGDTTPYSIAALYDYAAWTGDTEFIKNSWDSIKKAYSWCLSTDSNGDGLMDNKKAGLGALEFGELTGIETDIYLAAVWTRAAFAMQHLAKIAGDYTLSAEAAEHFQRAKQAFDEKFWNDELQYYIYAFNTGGKHVKEISPWNAVGLMWNLGTPERSFESLKRICSSELMTDWGIRSISIKSPFFQPLNYNYGAVWPFLASWVTTALYTHHMPLQAFCLLKATAAHTFDNALGCITEVFSGTHNIWPQEAVSHQGFSSAGVVLPFVRGLLGVEANALEKSLSFAPHFPGDWEHVSISNFKVGEAVFSFDYRREKNKLLVSVQAENGKGYTLHFAPALWRGSRILSLNVNGIPLDFKISEHAQVVQPQADIPLNEDSLRIELNIAPTAEILPSVLKAEVGGRNKGLKILSIEQKEEYTEIQMEGLANEAYEIRVLNPEFIEKVEGASFKDGKLQMIIPGHPGEFISHSIRIHTKTAMQPDRMP